MLEQQTFLATRMTPKRASAGGGRSRKLIEFKNFRTLKQACGPLQIPIRKQLPPAAEDVVENRAAYRAMCFSTPGLSEHISGVILHWETLMQEDAKGKPMVEIIKENGMIPGIKVDKGYNKKGIWGTSVGPLGHPEVATLGLDDLQQRCAQAYKDMERLGTNFVGLPKSTATFFFVGSWCSHASCVAWENFEEQTLQRRERALPSGATCCSWTL